MRSIEDQVAERANKLGTTYSAYYTTLDAAGYRLHLALADFLRLLVRRLRLEK